MFNPIFLAGQFKYKMTVQIMLFSVLVLLLFTSPCTLNAQDPTRFAEEIKTYLEESGNDYKAGETIVFTGSSSIRFWSTLAKDLPEYKVINRGFGGSQMSDLLHYHKDLILKYKPKMVFIYEGDNDIAEGKSTKQIMKDTKALVKVLRKEYKNLPIVFISAKPSIARWNFKEQYLDFNSTLEKYAKRKKNIDFVDVWLPMMNEDGSLNKGLFIEDDLHMNAAGYEIWTKVVSEYLTMHSQ